MNFSVHLPDPLLGELDRFAAAQAKSRSSIVREAVSEYIAARTANAWPEDMIDWMSAAAHSAKKSARKSTNQANDWPDFEAIRSESNANAAKRAAAL